MPSVRHVVSIAGLKYRVDTKWAWLGCYLKTLRILTTRMTEGKELRSRLTQGGKLITAVTRNKLLEKCPVYQDERTLGKIEAGELRPSRKNLIALCTEGFGFDTAEDVDDVLRMADYKRLSRQEIEMYRLRPSIPCWRLPIAFFEWPPLGWKSMRQFLANRPIGPEIEWVAKSLLASSKIGVYAVDHAGDISAWNPAAEGILGWRSEEVIGKPPPFLLDIPSFKRQIRETCEGGLFLTGRSSTYDVHYRNGGLPIEVTWWARVIRNTAREISGILFFVAPGDRWTQVDALAHDAIVSLYLAQVPGGLLTLDKQSASGDRYVNSEYGMIFPRSLLRFGYLFEDCRNIVTFPQARTALPSEVAISPGMQEERGSLLEDTP